MSDIYLHYECTPEGGVKIKDQHGNEVKMVKEVMHHVDDGIATITITVDDFIDVDTPMINGHYDRGD